MKFSYLRPVFCLYPEPNVGGGALSNEVTKSKLANDFDETIVSDLDEEDGIQAQLEKYSVAARVQHSRQS